MGQHQLTITVISTRHCIIGFFSAMQSILTRLVEGVELSLDVYLWIKLHSFILFK